MITENLPLKLYPLKDFKELKEVKKLRLDAYCRHVPEIREALEKDDENDYKESTTIYVVRNKEDNGLIGTIRIEDNSNGPLRLENVLKLPNDFRDIKLAEANRLACSIDKYGALAKKMLFKAFYLKLATTKVDGVILECRKELEYLYEYLLIPDIFPAKKTYVELKDLGGISHRVFGARLTSIEENWRKKDHPLRGFIEDKKHPDIEI